MLIRVSALFNLLVYLDISSIVSSLKLLNFESATFNASSDLALSISLELSAFSANILISFPEISQ